MSEWRITRLHGKYYLTWDEAGGVRRRYSLQTSDRKEATIRAPARFAELTRPRGSTVRDLWEGYCKDLAGRSVVETMGYTGKAVLSFFGKINGNAVTIEHCRSYTALRREQGRKDGSIHTELGHLRTVLVWAERHRLIERAPHIEKPSKPLPKADYLTRPEFRKLLAHTNVPHITIALHLMIATGARVSAALELTWDRVDFERRMITLQNPFDKTRRKGRAVVPMNDTLLEILREAKEAALTPYVVEWAGMPIKSIKKGLESAARSAGIQHVSPHMIRHSAAVWLAEDGHSMSEIAQFLGHSNTSMTEKVYARYSPDYLRKLTSSLEIK